MKGTNFGGKAQHGEKTQPKTNRLAKMEASVADAGSKSFGGDGDDGLLRMAVMNELIAPEVLPFQTELISKTKDFVDAEVCAHFNRPAFLPLLQLNLRSLSVKEEKSNQSYKGESEDAFLRRQLLTSWYLQRVKYALSAYLQTRLRKVPSPPRA